MKIIIAVFADIVLLGDFVFTIIIRTRQKQNTGKYN